MHLHYATATNVHDAVSTFVGGLNDGNVRRISCDLVQDDHQGCLSKQHLATNFFRPLFTLQSYNNIIKGSGVGKGPYINTDFGDNLYQQ